MQIEKNSIVSFRYIMKNGSGEVLENTMNSQPTTYLHGSQHILQNLQNKLEGLKKGDTKLFFYDIENENFVFEVTIDNVKKASEAEILLGYPVIIPAEKCDEDCECHKIN